MGTIKSGKTKSSGKELVSSTDTPCGKLLQMKENNPEKFESLFEDVDPKANTEGKKISRNV